MVNANRILHLNLTAAQMAYQVLAKTPQDQAVRTIQRAYRVGYKQANQDYAQIATQLDELIRPDGSCPIHEIGLDVIAPFSRTPSAPYRMDLALTYRCNNECSHCYNARDRRFPELTTQQWFRLLDKIWEIGIPHVVFTGGEPTLRDDLPILIAHAQQNGQITGLNTNGRRLRNPDYVRQLAGAGLDHVQITVESHNPVIHDRMVQSHGAWTQTIQGLENSLNEHLFVMTNTTMLQENSPSLNETLTFLGKLGVPTVGLNALIYSGHGAEVGTGLAESALQPLLEVARQRTEEFGQRLIWYTPTEYCNFDPMQLDLGVKGCTAALYNMCVEPNGDVLPCQSYYHSLGNLMQTEWNTIWNHELAVYLRDRHYVQEKCNGCALLSECGGGCPLLSIKDKELL